MFFQTGQPPRNYLKIKDLYVRYLETYLKLSGSLEGATPFADFYIYRIYISRYGERKNAASGSGYR